jgi:hypothetical protein
MYEFTDDLDPSPDREPDSAPLAGAPFPHRTRVRDGATYFALCPAGRTQQSDGPHDLWWSWEELA